MREEAACCNLVTGGGLEMATCFGSKGVVGEAFIVCKSLDDESSATGGSSQRDLRCRRGKDELICKNGISRNEKEPWESGGWDNVI